MARIQALDVRFKVAIQQTLAATQAEIVRTARRESARILNGDPRPSSFKRYVDGVLGAPETAVSPDGVIVYEFSYISEIVKVALQYLVERSPERSGRYKRSWFVMVDGQGVADPKTLGPGDTVMITNDQPYSRKIEVGHMRMSVPPGVVEDGASFVNRTFGNIVTAKVGFVYLPNGYILKGRFRRGYRPGARKRLREDTVAGAAMTYPTLIIKMR